MDDLYLTWLSFVGEARNKQFNLDSATRSIFTWEDFENPEKKRIKQKEIRKWVPFMLKMRKICKKINDVLKEAKEKLTKRDVEMSKV
jgi:hypothetical protein